jgi:hypothetical protein
MLLLVFIGRWPDMESSGLRTFEDWKKDYEQLMVDEMPGMRGRWW